VWETVRKRKCVSASGLLRPIQCREGLRGESASSPPFYPFIGPNPHQVFARIAEIFRGQHFHLGEFYPANNILSSIAYTTIQNYLHSFTQFHYDFLSKNGKESVEYAEMKTMELYKLD
jgi:hypothetical protein